MEKAKILVLYDSVSGNTKRMAELVAEGVLSLGETTVKILSINEATAAHISWCDGLAVGSPTYLGLLSGSLKIFFDKLVPELWGKVLGKIACAFSSEGGQGGGAELACQSILNLLINFGFLVFGVPDYTGPKQTLHYGAISAGKPETKEVKQACKRLGRRLAEYCLFLFYGKQDCHPLKQKYEE